MILDDSVITSKIITGAITTPKLLEDSVITSKILAGAVTTFKLGDGSVTTSKLDNDAIFKRHIAVDDCTSGQTITVLSNSTGWECNSTAVADGAITTAKLGTDSVIAIKIITGAVTTFKLLEDSVITSKILAGAVTTFKLGDGSITTVKLGDGSVTTPKINGGAVTTSKLGDGSVTTSKLGDGSVTTPKLGGGSVTTSKIGGGAVTTSKLGDGAVTTSKLGDGSVTTEKLGQDAVAEPHILTGAVTTTKLGDGAVTTEKLGSGVVRDKLAEASPVGFGGVPVARWHFFGAAGNQLRLETGQIWNLGQALFANVLSLTGENNVQIIHFQQDGSVRIGVGDPTDGVTFSVGASTLVVTQGKVAIGDVSPDARFEVVSTDGETDYVVQVSSTDDSTVMMGVRGNGHWVSETGTAPVLSSCGTTPSITGTDTAGKITIGTSASSTCTMTFADQYANAPACSITNGTDDVPVFATTSTTVLTITDGATDFSSDVIMYTCIGL